MPVFVRKLEFELIYSDPAVQRFNHYTTLSICSLKSISEWIGMVCYLICAKYDWYDNTRGNLGL